MHSHVCGDPVLHSRFCVLDGSRGTNDVPKTRHCDDNHHQEIYHRFITDMLAYVYISFIS